MTRSRPEVVEGGRDDNYRGWTGGRRRSLRSKKVDDFIGYMLCST